MTMMEMVSWVKSNNSDNAMESRRLPPLIQYDSGNTKKTATI
jgi:hypothetical protein